MVEVFEKYADGKSVRSIVEDFNARGLKTKRGKPFNINSFSSLLKNRKYIGEYRYQDVVIEGGVPAIVPEDLFNRVQERMEKNRHAPAMAKAKEDYLLTTRLFCGKCERMMVGESGKSHTGAMHYYYKCSGAKRLKDCDKKAVRKDWIERVVVRLTMQRVMDEEKINRLIDAILVMQEQEDTTTPALRSQLAETESSIGNILKAIEQGISLGTRVALAYLLSAIGVVGIWRSVPIGWFLADMAGLLYFKIRKSKLLPLENTSIL